MLLREYPMLEIAGVSARGVLYHEGRHEQHAGDTLCGDKRGGGMSLSVGCNEFLNRPETINAFDAGAVFGGGLAFNLADRLSLTLRVIDPFRTARERSATLDPAFTQINDRTRAIRGLQLSATWSFGRPNKKGDEPIDLNPNGG
jgi:hypothetical protein